MANTYYQTKDVMKFSICKYLITQGVKGSSSDRYKTKGIPEIEGLEVNPLEFKEGSFVGISINGRRKGRIGINHKGCILISHITIAMNANCKFVIDNNFNATRSYNIGERELRKFFLCNGYAQTNDDNCRSIWRKYSKDNATK